MDLAKFNLNALFGRFGGRKFLAIIGLATMYWAGYAVPKELAYMVGVYVFGQSIADGWSGGKTSSVSK